MDTVIAIKIRQLPHGRGLALPAKATPDSAGADLLAAISAPVTLAPGGRELVPCGFAMALPAGTEAQVRPRSGLALKAGITVLNSPGTIDADYRGEVSVLLINHGREPFTVQRGDRIAQMIIQRVPAHRFQVVAELDDTVRGTGGYGSTGIASVQDLSK